VRVILSGRKKGSEERIKTMKRIKKQQIGYFLHIFLCSIILFRQQFVSGRSKWIDFLYSLFFLLFPQQKKRERKEKNKKLNLCCFRLNVYREGKEAPKKK
jgi:hypothetical protein